MTDREMLELAAKAAGYKFKWFKVKQWVKMKGGFVPYRYCTGTIDVYGHHYSKPWNPIEDDGDALRLAVKMNLMHGKVFARSVEGHHDDGYDIYAATRRSIVLAAAGIGMVME